MPFDDGFRDIYKFGIRGAAEDAGAYAERLDEQIFTEGMLERIFNQIGKADVIVADMTGRNPNVFYEVGYAHALGKIVLLLTQSTADIPFDLQHHQHIIYGGSIDVLRAQLAPKVRWAIDQARAGTGAGVNDRLSIRVGLREVPPRRDGVTPPVVQGESSAGDDFLLPVHVRNTSPETSAPINHVYLFTRINPNMVPCNFEEEPAGPVLYGSVFNTPPQQLDYFNARSDNATEELRQYRLPVGIPAIPPAAVEMFRVRLYRRSNVASVEEPMSLRLHTTSRYLDYPFSLRLTFRSS